MYNPSLGKASSHPTEYINAPNYDDFRYLPINLYNPGKFMGFKNSLSTNDCLDQYRTIQNKNSKKLSENHDLLSDTNVKLRLNCVRTDIVVFKPYYCYPNFNHLNALLFCKALSNPLIL